MKEIFEFLVHYGAALLFGAVLVNQLGIPLPALPWLLAAGALARAGKINAWAVLGAATLASVLADMTWFYLGRYGGPRILSLLCRISLEPDSCVRRTQDMFARYGMRSVVAGKFIPGISTIVPPLAGGSGVSAFRFLFFDALGSSLWAGGYILLGVLFSRQLERILQALASLGQGAMGVVAGLAALYIGGKYLQRRRLLHKLQMARITVDELYRKLEAGENPVILDVRSNGELERNPAVIRTALHMTMSEVELRHKEIPRDRDIVLYCSCPNEVSAAKAALLLQKKGIMRVRPLLGGIDAWRERQYPMETRITAAMRDK